MSKNNIKEYSYHVYIRRAEKLSGIDNWSDYIKIRDTFTKVGGCEEKPFIKISFEGKKLISGGRVKSTKEKISFSLKDLQVNSSNYIFLRMLANNPTDIIFENGDLKRVIMLKYFRIRAELHIIGNDFDNALLSGELEKGYTDNHISFIEFQKSQNITKGSKLFYAGSNIKIKLPANKIINNGILYAGSSIKIKPEPNKTVFNGLFYTGSNKKIKSPPNNNIFNGLFYAGGE